MIGAVNIISFFVEVEVYFYSQKNILELTPLPFGAEDEYICSGRYKIMRRLH